MDVVPSADNNNTFSHGQQSTENASAGLLISLVFV